MAEAFELRQQNLVAFVPTADPARARVFYGDVLGLPLTSDELPFALVFDANGIMVRVTVVRQTPPANHTILGWQVSDIDEAAKALTSRGVEFQRYEGMNQNDLGVWDAPGGARVAWFLDPDGNILSISQHVA